MSKYRFKTKEQFIRDGLWDEKYNCPDNWAWEGQMNKYLGMDVPDEFNIHCNKKEEFEHDGWLFQNTDYILKEQQEYFDDLSQHIGRYIRALVDNPHLGSEVKKGDVGKIINKVQVDFPNRKGYSCRCALDKNYLGTKYELLPEDYSPEQEVKKPNVEFIPGKWYKVELSNKFNHYIKVDSVTEDKIILDCEGYVANLKKWDKATSINLKIVTKYELLTYLSEIQKYLPDGHPDKVTKQKFEIGKWYKWYQKDHRSYHYGKVKEINITTDTLVMTPWIIQCDEYIGSGTFDSSKAEQIQEISIEQIQEFLPNSHPDKITSDVFKKGEYIVLIGDGQSTAGAGLIQDSNQFIKNHCYKVRESCEHLRVELDSTGSKPNGWACVPYNPNKFHKTRNWRYATQEEIDEYERRGKPYDVTELNKQSFPDEGSIEIEYIPKNLMSYLENNNRKSVSGDSSYNKEKVVIAWNKSSFWFCSVESSKPKYSKDFIEKIIGKSIYLNTILEAKKELSMKEIQEECKRRFPIGCTYLTPDESTYVLRDDSYTYHIFGQTIWAHYRGGLLYADGKYATLVSLPEENITEIPEYIECTETKEYYFIKGNIYKVIDSNNLASAKLVSNIDFCDLKVGASLVCSMEINGEKYWKPSTKEKYDQQKTLTYESVSGCFPADKNIFNYDEISQYLSTAFDYWKNVPKFVEKEFDIYGPTPDIE